MRLLSKNAACARPCRQTEFNSSTARTSLLLIIARSPRPHRRVFRSTRVYVCIYGKVMKINFAVCGSLPLQSNIPRTNSTNSAPEVLVPLWSGARMSHSRKHDYYFIAMHQFEIMNIVPIVTGDLGEKQRPRNFDWYVYVYTLVPY